MDIPLVVDLCSFALLAQVSQLEMWLLRFAADYLRSHLQEFPYLAFIVHINATMAVYIEPSYLKTKGTCLSERTLHRVDFYDKLVATLVQPTPTRTLAANIGKSNHHISSGKHTLHKVKPYLREEAKS